MNLEHIFSGRRSASLTSLGLVFRYLHIFQDTYFSWKTLSSQVDLICT